MDRSLFSLEIIYSLESGCRILLPLPLRPLHIGCERRHLCCEEGFVLFKSLSDGCLGLEKSLTDPNV